MDPLVLTPEKATGAEKPRSQRLTVVCECGRKGGGYYAHYDLVRCDCGKRFVALQPKRGGLLKLFPHAGFAAANPR